MREVGAGTTDYFYGGHLNTVLDPNTFSGVFNGGTDGNKIGTFTLSAPDCEVPEEPAVGLIEGETGENGAPCRTGEMGEEEEYQRCNANAAGYRYCCGVGSQELGDDIQDFCGDGMESTEETFGFTRGGIQYSHKCGAFKLMASAGSILAAAFMM